MMGKVTLNKPSYAQANDDGISNKKEIDSTMASLTNKILLRFIS